MKNDYTHEEVLDLVEGTGVHYKRSVEPIELIESFELNFALGNVIKYVCRAGNKSGEARDKDLLKALNYLNREIEGSWID